jgi:hypothetical protein
MRTQYPGLDLIRFAAALLVTLFHLGFLWWANAADEVAAQIRADVAPLASTKNNRAAIACDGMAANHHISRSRLASGPQQPTGGNAHLRSFAVCVIPR